MMAINRVLRFCVAVVLLLSALPPSWSCLNDRDTLAEEAQGHADAIRTITGRFPRNPPLYYQMRITRVAQELAHHPDQFSDYDDIAVACDRLGRDTEAIHWMQQKRQHMPLLLATPNATDKEEWYTYYANIGTCRIHRWIHDGASLEKPEEARISHDEIAKAIAIKPNAHFGREKYQLKVISWMVYGSGSLYEYLAVDRSETQEAITGLCGLIALGKAWESVDIFETLGKLLRRSRGGYPSELEDLAELRCSELIVNNHHHLTEYNNSVTTAAYLLHNQSDTATNFWRLRHEADHWQQLCTDFMMVRLKVGRHPDTDPAFWNGYHETAPPSITMPWTRAIFVALGKPEWLRPNNFFIMPTCALLILIRVIKEWRSRRRTRQKATEINHVSI